MSSTKPRTRHIGSPRSRLRSPAVGSRSGWPHPVGPRSAAGYRGRAGQGARARPASVRIPFDSTKRPTNARVTGSAGSGKCHQRIDVDAGARDHRDALSIHPETLDHRAVVEILHQHRGARAVQQPSQRQPHDRRAVRTLAASLMNIVPRPVMALRQTTGRPVAASDPTTVAGKAT